MNKSRELQDLKSQVNVPTQKETSDSYNNLSNHQTWLILLILHPKLILQVSKYYIIVPCRHPDQTYGHFVIVIGLEVVVSLIYRRPLKIICTRPCLLFWLHLGEISHKWQYAWSDDIWELFQSCFFSHLFLISFICL